MKTKHFKNTISILAAFLKREKNTPHLCINNKRIIAQSGNTYISCLISESSETGETVNISPSLLKDLLAAIKSPEIELKTDENNLRIITDEREYVLPKSTLDIYAVLPPYKGETVASYEINEADMQSICYAGEEYAAKDDIRPVMQCIEIGEHIVATDSHQLLFRKSNIQFPVDTVVENPAKLYLHRSIAPLLKYATVGVLTNKNSAGLFACFEVICLNALNMEIYQKLPIDGYNKYPNWPAVIPYDNPNIYEVSKAELMGAIKSLSYITKLNNKIVFTLNGKGTVKAESVDYNLEQTLELNTYVKKEAVDYEFTIGFDPKSLATVLDTIPSDTVTFNCSMPKRPVIINDDVLLMQVLLDC